jgi:hypothetical protein
VFLSPPSDVSGGELFNEPIFLVFSDNKFFGSYFMNLCELRYEIENIGLHLR